MNHQDILVNFPNDVIFINSKKSYKNKISSSDIILQALKIKLKGNLFNCSLYKVSENKNIFNILNFTVKVYMYNLIECPEFIRFTQEDTICAPQIIVLAGFDQELQAVNFRGAFSGNEFNNLLNEKSGFVDEILIPIEKINGGFSKLLQILSAFDSNQINSFSFLKNLSYEKFTLGKVRTKKFLDYIQSESDYSIDNALNDLNVSINQNIREFRVKYLNNWKKLFKRYASKDDAISRNFLIKINKAVDLLDSLSDDDLVKEFVP